MYRLYMKALTLELIHFTLPVAICGIGASLLFLSTRLTASPWPSRAFLAFGILLLLVGVLATIPMAREAPAARTIVDNLGKIEEFQQALDESLAQASSRIRAAEKSQKQAEVACDVAQRMMEAWKARAEERAAETLEASDRARRLEQEAATEHKEALAEIRRLRETFHAIGGAEDVTALADLCSEQSQTILKLEGALHQSAQERETADQKASDLRVRLRGLEAQLSELLSRPAVTPSDNPPERAACFKSVLSGSPTLGESLRFFQDAFPDRLVVLDSASRSAKDSEGFAHPDQAFDLLRRLVIDYFEALDSGLGDTKAREVFGKGKYAAVESETVSTNTRAQALRTFSYKGYLIVMNRHLKLGHRPGPTENVRIHFHWDAEDRKVVIGWAGPHLDHG